MSCKKFSRGRVNFKFAVKGFFLANKIMIISLCVAVLLGLLTGIFVAIKSGITISNLPAFNIEICEHTGAVQFASVWERFCSVLINFGLITVASLYVLLIPIGYIVVAYRAYLLGFNITVLICLFGIAGAITSILVILPCQLAILAVLIAYFTIMVSAMDARKKYGRCSYSIFKIVILFLIVLFVLCLIETVLLGVFSASTILVV